MRVAGGLLFELLGQSVGEEAGEDVPVVLRSWQAQRYLITAAHVKGDVDSNLNVLGVVEVQVRRPRASVLPSGADCAFPSSQCMN